MKTMLQVFNLLIFAAISLQSFAERSPQTIITRKPTNIKMLSTFLLTANGQMADGNRVVFDSRYSNSVDGNDAIKLLNPGTNFGLARNNKLLAVEARQPLGPGDTLFYNMTNLSRQSYSLRIIPDNLSAETARCELIDKFLNTRETITLSDSNNLTLEITADPASSAANRLMIVFSSTTVSSPFSFGFCSATETNSMVSIHWTSVNDSDIDHYELQRSQSAEDYQTLSNLSASHAAVDQNTYQQTDLSPLKGLNFYRVKAVSRSGLFTISEASNILFSPQPQLKMNVYPNPVVNHTIQLEVNQLPAGDLKLQVMNNSGQVVMIKSVISTGSRLAQSLALDNNLPTGNYSISVLSAGKVISSRQVIIQ